MEQRARRWLIWSGIAVVLAMSLAIALAFAFWYVVWPFSPKWVAVHSPWTAPQIRALAIVHLWGTDLETVRRGQQVFAKSVSARGTEVERGIIECLRSGDPNLRWMAFFVMHIVAKHGTLTPQLCSEIIAGLDDPDSAPRSVARGCVKLLPANQAQPILRRFLEVGDPHLQAVALDALAKPGAFDLTLTVSRLLADPERRYDALILMARIQDPAAIPMIRPYLEDSQPYVQEAARDFLRIMETSSNK